MSSTAVSLKEFFAVDGSQYNQRDADVIGPVIAGLSEDGVAAPRDLLNAARSGASPIHRYFEWNDATAADLYRLDQAKGMLRAIKVVVSGRREADDPMRKLRASVPQPQVGRSMKVLSTETSQAAETASKAYAEIAAWKRKYESSCAAFKKVRDVLGAVVSQIGECEASVNAEGIHFKTDAAMVDLVVWRSKHGASAESWAAWSEQMDFLMEAISEADDALCAATKAGQTANCVQCGKPFTPRHERHRLCEAC